MGRITNLRGLREKKNNESMLKIVLAVTIAQQMASQVYFAFDL